MQSMKVFLLLSLLAVLVIACGGSQEVTQIGGGLPQGSPVETGEGRYYDIDVNQVKPLLDDASVFTVNVHVPYAGELPGTDALVAYNTVEQEIGAFPADKEAPIVLYCRSGSMSADAAETLVELGYTRVLNVSGGMNAWQRAGNQLVRQ